ncbi:MAG: hypothetical protein WD738_17830 [Pirellulales bacterium]
MNLTYDNARRPGHTLMELVVAMIASVVLLAGLGAVMFIGSQVAYTPSASVRRTQAAEVINQISDELRCATLIIQQTPQILEFVVADRNNDGAAEKIRYEWSGVPGAALYRRLDAGASIVVLDSVNAFSTTFLLKPETADLKTTVDSAETILLSNTNVQAGTERDVAINSQSAHQVNPAVFSSIPANAISWNATKVDFQGRQTGSNSDTLYVQLRASGDPFDAPTSSVLGQVTVLESTLTASMGWNTVVFPNPARNLSLYRNYTLVWAGMNANVAAKILTNDSVSTGVLESNDSGATWQFMTTRQMYSRLYGTYTTPGPTYNVTRDYVSHVRLVLQASEQSHARIDASIPLVNLPELLSAYWRADFDRNPNTTDGNGDATADWAVTGGGSFDTSKLISGIWLATGALETRPLSDFTTTTTVDVRCRNTGVGGNGAVVRINVDRQGGLYAPILVYVQRQNDGTQTLTLSGKSSDAQTVTLYSRQKLPAEFLRFRLTILPQHNLVNLQINDEDQGTYTYRTYAPASPNDRFLTLYADTSLAEFDYVDVRVSTN